MDVLTLILTCSLFADDQLVAAIAHVHSNGNPYFVSDAAALVTTIETPRELAAAKGAVAKIQAQHGRPLIGLMAVPASQASAYGRSPEDLFDPCTNIAVGSAMLSQFAYECGGGPADDRRTTPRGTARPARAERPDAPERPRLDLRQCMIRKYALAQDLRAADYMNVFTAAVQMALNRPASSDEPVPERSSIFPDGADFAGVPEWDSEQQLFFTGAPKAFSRAKLIP